MRILLATDHYPPFLGGAQRQSRLLALRMAERGHEVTVATTWHGGLPAREQEDGVDVRRIRQLRTAIAPLARNGVQQHQPPFPDPVSVWQLRRLIAAKQPEVIHSYGWITYSVAAAIGRRRIPLLVSARDYGYFCATRTLVQKGRPCSGPAPLKCLLCAGDYYDGPGPRGWLAVAGVYFSRRLMQRKISGLHSVSAFVDEVTRRHVSLPPAVDEEPVAVVIPSFQDEGDDEPGDEAEVAAALKRLPSQPFILFVGAFRKIKGLEILFAAYRMLESPPPLVLMGTMERDAPDDFPPKAVIIADVPHPAVMAAWRRAMFGVMPSLWPEPFGATVAEAMKAGCPVIGTRLGGHADILDEETGILVPQGDPDALAAAMRELIADPERREALGRAAEKRARDFSAAQALPRFEQAYASALRRTSDWT